MQKERTQKIKFEGAFGQKLAASIVWPQGKTRAFAIFAHCFSCSKEFIASRQITNALSEHGFAVLRFDFTGLGSSEGDFADTNFTTSTQDLIKAANWLDEKHDAPSLLVGHSLGGAAVLNVAAKLPQIKAVATIGAPADPEHVLHLFGEQLAEIEKNGEATVDLGGRPFKIKSQFIADVRGQNITSTLSNYRGGLLVLHSPIDQTVGIENAEQIFKAAKHPKSFVSLDDADHLMTNSSHAAYAAKVIGAWAERFIPSNNVALEDEGDVVAAESGEGKYHLHVNAGGHHLSMDEPVGVGGTNRGATPYDMLAAALGGCTT